MRHITPYSFLEEIINKYTTNIVYSTPENSKSHLDLLSTALQNIVYFEGLGFSKEDYSTIGRGVDKFIKGGRGVVTHKPEENIKTKYYLIDRDDISASLIKILNDPNKETAKDLYQKQMKKAVKYIIDELKDSIVSYDSLMIINQVLIKYTLTLFNARPNTSLPKEGHSLPYSIRLFDTENDAENDIGLFKTLTSDELLDKINKCDTIGNKIRVCQDEVPVVKATKVALKCLNKIIVNAAAEIYMESTNQINEYNRILTYRVLKQHQEKYEIKKTDPIIWNQLINKLCTHNIPDHLYEVFDLKPLEQKVFVPYIERNDNSRNSKSKDSDEKDKLATYPVYCYSDNKETANYYFVDGNQYRDNDISANKKGKNKPSLLRKDITVEFLVKKVFDHVKVALLAFFDFNNSLPNRQQENDENEVPNYSKIILENFSKKVENLVALYNFDSTKYTQYYESMLENDGMFHLTLLDTSTTSSTTAAVKPQGDGNIRNYFDDSE